MLKVSAGIRDNRGSSNCQACRCIFVHSRRCSSNIRLLFSVLQNQRIFAVKI